MYIFDERTINFQAVNRKLFQVIKGRVANTKVVDRDGNPSLTELIEHSYGRVHILHNGTFRNFKFQITRVESGLLNNLNDFIRKALILKLAGRDIDCNLII